VAVLKQAGLFTRRAKGPFCRQWRGVYGTDRRSVGLPSSCEAGLLPSGNSDRQCVYRILQWIVPGRVPECALVPVSCRSQTPNRGMEERLQCQSSSHGSWQFIAGRICCQNKDFDGPDRGHRCRKLTMSPDHQTQASQTAGTLTYPVDHPDGAGQTSENT
jgi:hypothetical protein